VFGWILYQTAWPEINKLNFGYFSILAYLPYGALLLWQQSGRRSSFYSLSHESLHKVVPSEARLVSLQDTYKWPFSADGRGNSVQEDGRDWNLKGVITQSAICLIWKQICLFFKKIGTMFKYCDSTFIFVL